MTTAYAGAVARIGAFGHSVSSELVSCWRLLFWRCCTYFLQERAGAARFARQPKIGRLRPLWEFQWGKLICSAFALGTALAGIAGGLVSVSYSISPSIGLEWTLKALIVVVLARPRFAVRMLSPVESCSGSPRRPVWCFSAVRTERSSGWFCSSSF